MRGFVIGLKVAAIVVGGFIGWGLAPIVEFLGSWYVVYPVTMIATGLIALWVGSHLWMVVAGTAGWFVGKSLVVPLLVVQPTGWFDRLQGIGMQASIQEIVIPIISAVVAICVGGGIISLWKMFFPPQRRPKKQKKETVTESTAEAQRQ